jgi:glutaredoxin 3
VEHAIGLAEANRAQNDRVGRIGACGHGSWRLATGTDRAGYALEAIVARIQMYTTRWCGYCVRAKTLLDSRQLPYEEISLDDDPAFRQTIHDLTGGWTVPQILIDGQPIGGYTELWRLDRDGRLDALLAA